MLLLLLMFLIVNTCRGKCRRRLQELMFSREPHASCECHGSRVFTFFSNFRQWDGFHNLLHFLCCFSSFMTDETQRLGIISRRVCGDLLQRLLGSAVGSFESTSAQASAPVSRTQGCSTPPGDDKNLKPETRAGNGLVDKDFNGGGDDLDGLPPLEGEDSDKENENTVSVNASPPAKVSEKGDAKDKVRVQGNAVTSGRPLSHLRPSTMGDANVAPFRLVCVG